MSKKRLAGLIIAVVVVFLVGGAIAYWSIGLSIYNRGVAAHNDLDVETAVGRYQVVMRYYPDFLGGFVSMAARNQQACLAYQSARRAYDAADYGTACERYDQFLADYQKSSLLQKQDCQGCLLHQNRYSYYQKLYSDHLEQFLRHHLELSLVDGEWLIEVFLWFLSDYLCL